MPMYEFFCNDCNTIYTFFSRSINTEKIPSCPKHSSHALQKMISRFAVTGIAKENSGDQEDGGMPDFPIDESRMEKAMETLASEAQKINQDDPREAASLMRRLSDIAGIRFGDKMQEAISRMESGDDPEAIEQELGDVDEKDLFQFDGTGSKVSSRKRGPVRDETMYDM